VGSLFWLVPIPLVDSCSSSRLRLLPQCDGVGAASGCRRGRGTAASRPAGWTRWNWRRVNATSRGRRRPYHARRSGALPGRRCRWQRPAEHGGDRRRRCRRQRLSRRGLALRRLQSPGGGAATWGWQQEHGGSRRSCGSGGTGEHDESASSSLCDRPRELKHPRVTHLPSPGLHGLDWNP